MQTPSKKDRAFLMIHKGMSFEDIAEELEVTYTTVVNYSKDFKRAENEGKLDAIINQDMLVIQEIAENLPVDATSVVKSLNGLDRLNNDIQHSAKLIINKLNIVTSNVGPDDVMDLATCAKILCDLQNAFFNKNSVNLNVQNNNFDASQSTYGEFLSDKPPIN